MIELGKKVRDTVSGFVGVAVAEHTYLNGCRRYSVQQEVDKYGKLPEAQAFDEMQLCVVDEMAEGLTVGVRKTGGPEQYRDTPRHIPKR